jgi:pimeloyl-ACP methyl ester carboxylesterase
MEPVTDPDDPAFRYDEFGFFGENAAEYGLPLPQPVPVERVQATTSGGVVSALRWGRGVPQLVFLHGGSQNAHTWDTVLLALGCPAAICVDLLGHGHSEHRPDGDYSPRTNAAAVREALIQWGVNEPVVLVGMSLGGLSAIALMATAPELVAQLVIVDVTPGVNAAQTADIVAFISGPQTFPTFNEIFTRTVEFNPTRSAASLRRGILHNAHRLVDGSWAWRYDRRPDSTLPTAEAGERTSESVGGQISELVTGLWDDMARGHCPITLCRGALSPVVSDADVAELRRRRPDAVVETFERSGHSIQGDQPVELAALIRRLATPTAP